MSKHTPGPWHWHSDPIKGDPLGRVRYTITALGRTIATIYYSSDETGQAEADARLIAMAPDLFDLACKNAEASASQLGIELVSREEPSPNDDHDKTCEDMRY